MSDLHSRGQMTVRTAYNLFTQRPKHELEDFTTWTVSTELFQGDEMFRLNGAGEMLVYSAADFEDFHEPRPQLDGTSERELEKVVRLLAEKRWPFRLHATYDESIERFMNVFEKVDRDVPLNSLHWFFDHAETITDRNMERVAALGGGIAIQHRMAFQGEYFVERYGAEAARRTPPIRRMLAMGIPVGAGTDATRVATFNPFVSLYWLVSGKTVGGMELYPREDRMSREDALRLYTKGSSWFSTEENVKGGIFPGQLADFAVLTDDYFKIPEDKIRGLESALTVVGGTVVYANDAFRRLAPPPLPSALDWSPTRHYGGHHAPINAVAARPVHGRCTQLKRHAHSRERSGHPIWGFGCDCHAF
jgi:predicted amidohydrolase YtcJ